MAARERIINKSGRKRPMSNEDKEALIEHLEAALAILRGDTEASAQSGGSGNGPPPEGP